MVAVIPALVLGAIFSKKIDTLLESPLTVAITMLAGGIILLFIDKLFTQSTVEKEESISLSKAFTIGIWQCLAMIPGTSRSAASIIGGMQQKLTRNLAAEFSFFLNFLFFCFVSFVAFACVIAKTSVPSNDHIWLLNSTT